MIPIRGESDVARACELAHDVAATIPLTAAGQSRLAEAVSRVARVLLDSPQHGYLALASLREGEVAGVAVVVRFVGQGQGAPARPSIEEIGGEFDRIEKSETGGDLLVTLIQWKREGEQQNSACAGTSQD